MIESIDGDRAVVRVRAGQDPTSGANLVARKVTGVPVSALRPKLGRVAPSEPPAEPIQVGQATGTAKRQVAANRDMLTALGVRRVEYRSTEAASGVEFGSDSTLRIAPSKLAASMTEVRDIQARNGIAGTPEDWFAQVLTHEGIHAADLAVAEAKGQTLQQRYEALPAEAMPEGWQAAGRDAYGPKSWDALPEWKQRAEFVRQVVEGKWTGKITEQLYRFIKEAIDFLKNVAGFKEADPRFKAHVEEVESRIEAARQSVPTLPTYRAGGRATYGRRAATIQAIEGETATIQLKGSKTPIQVPLAELKPPVARRFVLPSTGTGQPDVIDHIAENGGMRGSVAGKRIAAGKSIDVAGDYDDRPNLKGVYQNAVFGGNMTPDQMASLLHEDHGIGDGSVGSMYSEIDRAMQARGTARTEMQRQATEQKQADRFDRDATEQATAKGAKAINTSDLNVGDKVQVGDQTLKVIGVDPDNLDVTLEDHAKYGVQRVADGTALYVEKVQPSGGDNSLAAARPDRQTMDLFPEDEPFDLRGEALPDAARVAAAREMARQQPAAASEQPASPLATVPRISAGERGTGDLFQGDDAPFNLQGEQGIDGARAQQEAEQAARDAAEAKANQDRDQLDFTTVPAPEPASETPAATTETIPTANPRPVSEKAPAGIRDFGEKIQGARKDVWGKFGRAMQEGLPAEASDITLSKHFPEPDYEKLLADGVPVRDLATMKALRDMIPPKPQRSYKLAAWGQLVKGMHEAMKQLVSPEGSVTSAKIDAILAGSRQIANQVNLYRDLGYPAFTRAKDWTLRDGTFDTFMGRRYSPPKTIAYAEHKGRMQMDMSSEAPTAAERSAEIAAQVKQKIDATADLPPAAKETKFGLYVDRYTNEAFIGKKGPNGVVRVKTGFKNTREALDYMKSNKDELAAKWEEMKQPPNLRRAANNPRVGVERRDGDVAPEQFQDAFGFRGVQFGNYVEGPRRQADLNEAFDALTDLSETLGIPTKALSLDGSLGLAFGARGGGTAKAHYEPGQVVINLTKTQGPGSLAHEWFHALDNYFARLDRTGDTAPAPVDGYGTRDTARPQNMRPEVWQAFKGIRDVVNRGDFSRRSGALDATRSKPYYGTTIEKAARAFETYVEERLAKTGISNDYLVNIDKAGSDAYPTKPELDGGIRGAYDNLFNTLDTKETEKGTALYAAPPEEENAPATGRPQTPDPSRVDSIKDLVDQALTPGSGGRKKYSPLGTVTPAQAAHMQSADMPLDLSGYRHNLDNFGVRHIWGEHGDPAAEIARGNLPLNRGDFEKLPGLLDRPTASLLAGTNPAGQQVILHALRVNGHYVIAEEVRTAPKVLSVTTLFKKPAPSTELTPPPASGAAPVGAASSPTSETLRSTALVMLRQVAQQYNFKHGGGDSLAAAAPEPVDVAGAKNPDDPTNLRSTRAAWKAVGVKSPMFKRYFGDWQKDPANASKVVDATGKPLVVYHGSPALANGGGFDAFHVPASAGDLLAGSGVYLTNSKPIAQSYTLNRDELLSGGSVDAGNVPASTPVMPLYANIRKPFQAGDAGLADARAIVAAELAKQPPEPPLRRRDGTVIQPPSAAERAAQAVDNAAQLYPPGDPLRSYHVLRDALSNEGVIQSARIAGGDQLRDVLRAHGFDGIIHEGGVQGGQKHQVFVAFDPAQVKSAEPAGSARSNSGAFDPTNPSMLAAAAPEAEDPLFEKPVAPASSTLKKGSQAWIKAKLAEQRAQKATEDAISAHKDAVENMAVRDGRHAGNGVELDFPNDLDNRAAGPLAEAGYNRQELAADLAKVQASPNKKLAAKYAPIYQHALDNLPRLTQAAEGWRQRKLAEDAAAERAGLPPSWQTRMQHLHDDPLSPQSTIAPNEGFGATKGFKKAADALAAGVDPKSTRLSDHAEKYVTRNRTAINEHSFQGALASLKTNDGKPMVSSITESGTKLNAAGDPVPSAKVPKGYQAVQAGDNVLVAHDEIAPLLRALYGESAVANNFLGKHLLDLAALTKHGAIGIDTYHGFQTAIRSVLGFQVADYRLGLASLNYADADLDRAVKAGKITQAAADDARENRAIDESMDRQGLNVGASTDNLLNAARQHNLIESIPVIGHAATWVNHKTFQEVQPSYMRMVGRIAYKRARSNHPEWSEEEVARQASKETNDFYGNIGRQGFLKSKTMQDVSKLTFFAPGFAQGRFRTEVRGIGQAAQAVADGVRGRGWRVGVVAQAMSGIILASIIGNQALNLFTRGKPTWENEEEGHKFDAWLPGGPHGKGFFFSPLSIAAEYSHALIKYMEHRESAVDALAHIAGNKLSGGARAVKTLVTGKDYKGQPFASMGERLKAAALEVLPLPMQLSPWVDKDPKGLLGLKFNHEKGSLEKQLLASAGLRVDPADSARSQMFNLAQQFRGPQADQQPHGPSAYAALRTALGNEDANGARAEIQRLVTVGHKTLGQIADKAAGIKDGKVHPELFTGSRDKDLQMLASLTPAQKQVYRQAFQDRVADARLFAHLSTAPRNTGVEMSLAWCQSA